MTTSKITKTTHFSAILDKDSADNAYKFIKENTKWKDGIFSQRKQKMTRKGYSPNLIDFDVDMVDELISQLVANVLKKIDQENKYSVEGVYLNYYRDGNDFAPSHRHDGMIQLVISLGATRTLKVGTKEYKMNNGDAIIFGSSNHEVPVEENVKDGRISIATFMTKN